VVDVELTPDPAPLRAGRRDFGWLLAGRVVEQAVLGLGGLGLARAVGVRPFAAISTLLVVNSLSTTLSDFGLGSHLLRLPPGRHVSRRSLVAARAAAFTAGVVAVVVGLVVGGDAGGVCSAGGVLWWLTAESSITKSAALRDRRNASVAVAESIASVVTAGLLVAAMVSESEALLLVAVGLVAKPVVEVLLVRRPRSAFGAGPGDDRFVGLWVNQLVAVANNNVDYVVVGVVLGPTAFALYVLAFRLTSLLPSQLAYVTGRLSAVDLAAGEGPAARAATYRRYVTLLFAAGVCATVATAGAAPVLPTVLGDEWRQAVAMTAMLAVAIPWRMTYGLVWTAAAVDRVTASFVLWDGARFVLAAVALVAAAAFGLEAFVVTSAVVTVVGVTALHAVVSRLTAVRVPRWLHAVAVAAVAGLLVAAAVTDV
jgi:PST family polysaccharide transporter